jgi:hypothetical protein
MNLLRRTLSWLSFLSTTGALRNFLGRVSKTLQMIVSILVTSRRLLTLALISWCKPRKSLYDGKLLTMSPPWILGVRFSHGKAIVSHTLLSSTDISHNFQGGDYAVATTKSAGFVEEELLYVKLTTTSHLLAVLSQRLALDSNTPQYIFYSANPFKAVKRKDGQLPAMLDLKQETNLYVHTVES